MKSRLAAVLVVLLVWAVIYLPALGSIAIKGEEGRRILAGDQDAPDGKLRRPRSWRKSIFSKAAPRELAGSRILPIFWSA